MIRVRKNGNVGVTLSLKPEIIRNLKMAAIQRDMNLSQFLQKAAETFIGKQE